MRLGVIVVTLALATTLAACESRDPVDDEQLEHGAKQRKDPVAGVANNLQGIQRGSEDGFGRAADSTQ